MQNVLICVPLAENPEPPSDPITLKCDTCKAEVMASKSYMESGVKVAGKLAVCCTKCYEQIAEKQLDYLVPPEVREEVKALTGVTVDKEIFLEAHAVMSNLMFKHHAKKVFDRKAANN